MDKLLENDPELARFIAEQEQNERLKKQAYELTKQCWDLCVNNPGVAKFDGKVELCLVNCVDRFIDTSKFITETFASKAGTMSSSNSSMSSSGISSSSMATTGDEMILEDKFSSGSSHAEEPPKKKGWW